MAQCRAHLDRMPELNDDPGEARTCWWDVLCLVVLVGGILALVIWSKAE
jgi:hypothetical protein